MTVVDHQAHWLPRPLMEALQGRDGYPRTAPADGSYVIELAEGHRHPLTVEHVDLDAQLATADELGIDVMVSVPTMLGEVLHWPAAEAAEWLDRVNETVAAAQREHAGRFAGLALLPLQDLEAALSTLERAVSVHDLRGVSILANLEGKPPASQELLPLYRRIEELGLPVFLHPSVRSITWSAGLSRRGEAGLAWMFHTSLAALSFVDSGVLDLCPGLAVVHPHLGGMLPYAGGRPDNIRRADAEFPKRRLLEYLRTSFYTDCVAPTPGALELALAQYGRDRVLFGTDHPYVPKGAVPRFLERHASPGDVEQVKRNRLPGLRLD